MQKIHETWNSIPSSRVRTTPEIFFKSAYGFDLDRDNRTHIQHLSAVKEFLNQRVGHDAYIAKRDGICHYVKWNVKEMNVSKKIQHVLNENLGIEVTVLKVQDLILETFDTVAHRTQISKMMRILCEKIPTASRKAIHIPGKSGRTMFYTFPDTIQDSQIDFTNKTHFKNQERYKNKQKVAKSDQSKSEGFKLFHSHDFITVNNETFVKIIKEDAVRAEEIFSRTRAKLQDTKARLAEIIDENQQLNHQLRVLTAGKVTSISDTLDEIEKDL